MVNGDMAGVIAMITARQPIVDGLHKMRQLAADPALRSSITTDAAVDECLFAPTTVVRQAKTSGEVGGCPFRRGSLFILGLGSASKGAANRDLLFLSQSWSRCPAKKWVPALLEGVSQLRCMSLKNFAAFIDQFLTSHRNGARGETPVLPVYGEEE